MIIFQKARLKLTAWYVLIIMIISLSFSFFVYRNVMEEVSRGFRLRSVRALNEIPSDWIVVRDNKTGIVQVFPPDDDLFEQIRSKVITQLAFVNGLILGGSAMAGYFLAGKTLRPIEVVMEDQKRFIGDASHELRTPLTSMKTEIEVNLRDKDLDLKSAKSLLASNLEEVNKMQALSNYLLSLSRYEEGETNLKKEPVELQPLISKVLMRFEPIAEKKGSKITSKIPEVTIRANGTSIEELVSILLDNAIKYGGNKGKVNVAVNQRKNSVVLTVSDSGVGIKSSDIPYIFNRFYRADSSRTKDKIDGYGLGLSIAKSIVDMHKGKIEVHSVVSEGTTFKVTLPA